MAGGASKSEAEEEQVVTTQQHKDRGPVLWNIPWPVLTQQCDSAFLLLKY